MHDLRNDENDPPRMVKHRPSRADKKWEHDLFYKMMEETEGPIGVKCMHRNDHAKSIEVSIRA